MASRNQFLCPHCSQKLYLRTSKLENALFRVAYFQCTNIRCGFSARAQFEITHQITPSAMPNPLVHLKAYGEEDSQDPMMIEEGHKSETTNTGI